MQKSVVLVDRVMSRSVANDIALVGLGAAFTAVMAQISIPSWPVPMTMQTLAVLFVGLTLGAARGSLSMVLYLTVGALGAPVFSGGVGLYSIMATLGYLVGFVFAAALLGALVARGWDRGLFTLAAALILATLVVYSFGVAWLVAGFGLSLVAAITGGIIPFLIGDSIKIAIVIAVTPIFRKYVK